MSSRLALALAASTMLAGAAVAADVSVRRAEPVFTPVPVFTWTGFYVGAHGGFASTAASTGRAGGSAGGSTPNVTGNTADTIGNAGGGGANPSGNAVGASSNTVGASGNTVGASGNTVGASGNTVGASGNTVGASGNTVGASGNTVGASGNTVGASGNTVGAWENDNGFIGGGQIGFNYVFNQTLLLGVEADTSSVNLTQRMGVSAEQSLKYLGTVRGRFGLAWYPFLVYATGGLAYGDVSYQATSTESRTEMGYTYGAGLEYAVTSNISVRGEYLAYFDLGRELAIQGTPFSPMQGRIGRVGLNYRF